MIEIDNPSGNILHIKMPEKLDIDDFKSAQAIVDPLIEEHGKIRLILDATHFHGWEGIKAAEEHFSFVHSHHHKIECIAIIAGQVWQHWLAIAVSGFLTPNLKIFTSNQEFEAWKWIKNYHHN